MSALYLFLVSICFFGVYFLSTKNNLTLNFKRYIAALAFVSLPFLIWDWYATKYGHWAFNETYTFGVKIAGMPLSEILFFVAIPLYYITLYELFRTSTPLTEAQKVRARRFFILARLIGVPLLTLLAVRSLNSDGMSYTFIVSTVAAITILLLSYSLKFTFKPWILTNFYSFIAFVIFNAILTAVPIVTYSSYETLNFRIGSIPLEDFLYNFALTNLFLLAYTMRSKE